MPYNVVMFSGINAGAYTAKTSKMYYYRPAGMYRIASHLRQNGISVKTVDYFSQMSSKQFQQAVDKYVSNDTKLIGISATVLLDRKNNCFFGVSDEEFKQRIDYIKSKNPSIKVIVGGGQITATSASLLKKFKNEIDFLSRGQGENTVLAIYNHVAHGTSLTTSSIDPLKEITDSVYSFDDFNNCRIDWNQDDTVLPNECLPIEIARGCIFKCKYCGYSLTGKKFNDWTKTEETIRTELLSNFKRYGIQHYQFVDDLINDSPEKIDLLEKVIKSLPFKIYFSGYIRLDLLWKHPKMIQQLKDIGLISCFMGIETINDASGKAVGKGLGKKRIIETLELCHNIWQGEVHIEAHFILGLPKDTDQTGIQTFEWAKQVHEQGHMHKVVFKPLIINPYSGESAIDKDPEKFGYKIAVRDLKEYDVGSSRYFGDVDITWTLENYNSEQAEKESIEYNNYFLARTQIPITNTFNAPHILSLVRSKISEEDMVKIMTNKQKMTPEQLVAVEESMDFFAQQRIQKYFDSL